MDVDQNQVGLEACHGLHRIFAIAAGFNGLNSQSAQGVRDVVEHHGLVVSDPYAGISDLHDWRLKSTLDRDVGLPTQAVWVWKIRIEAYP